MDYNTESLVNELHNQFESRNDYSLFYSNIKYAIMHNEKEFFALVERYGEIFAGQIKNTVENIRYDSTIKDEEYGTP